jgi:N-acyl-D-amino-acid deacylase
VPDYDLAIVHGTIVDGTGTPAFPGTIFVAGNRLMVQHEPEPAPPSDQPIARRVIDATGLLVAPGFIDLHSHSGLMILAEPRHEPKVRQGVTTEIIGVDGNAYAPFRRREDLLAFAELNAGLDGKPDLRWDWRTVDEYLALFDRRVSVNIGYLVGNSALRINALGWDDVPADVAAMDQMRGELRAAMQAGAFGVSSGLDYPPGSFASTGELAELTAEAAALGGIYHTHVRYPLGDRFLDPFREAIGIGQRSGGPVHITHFYHRPTYPGSPEQMIELVTDARAQGLDVTWDTYPSEWASTRLLIMLPPWVQAGGPGPLRERLRDGAIRDRLRLEIGERGRAYANDNPWASTRLGAFETPQGRRWEGHTLQDVMDETGADVVETVCELLLQEDLALNQVTSGPWIGGILPFLRHPLGMVGTDSTFVSDKPAPRTYGSYPRILGEFVREMGLMPVEEAVRKMTSAPASRLGITDRGRLADGLKADIVVFDPHRVASRATYDVPRQFPVGIPYVIVNGEVVIDAGRHTGALPGRALRHGRDA